MLTASGTIVGNAADALREMLTRLENTRPLVEKMAVQAAASQRRNIDERHAPDGTPYKALSDTTLALRGMSYQFTPAKGGRGARLTMGGDHPNGDAPLKDSGRMYDSIHPEVLNEEESWAGPLALEAYYFAYQNQGTSRRGNWRPGETVTPGIPARPFIGISVQLRDLFQLDVAEHIKYALSFTDSVFFA
jgi:hypothetical protein